MRIDVKKFIFIGMQELKEAFFKKAQALGIIHFINVSGTKRIEAPVEVQQTVKAIKVLRGLPPMEQEENFDYLDADKLIPDILLLHHSFELHNEEIRVLKLEMARVAVFGDFSLSDIEAIEKESHKKFQFFVAKEGAFHEEPLPENVVYIASEHNLDYYIALNDRPTHYEKMVEMHISRPYNELKRDLSKAESEAHQVFNKLKEHEKFKHFLHHALTQKLNRFHLTEAQEEVYEQLDGTLFVSEGWVPLNKIDELDRLMKEQDIYYEEIAIEPNDVEPTYLENQGLPRLGEDLVSIYDTPSATDKDPSDWLLWAFALFFAFIIGDAGYGLIYLSIALFIRYKNPTIKGVGKRVLNLFTFLSIGCVIWGVLTTSFFGMQVEMDNPIRDFSLTQWITEKKAAYHFDRQDETYRSWTERYPELKGSSNVSDLLRHHTDGSKIPNKLFSRLHDNVIFEMALFIGVAHIILSLLRYSFRNWTNFGWIIFLVGAYLYFPYHLGVPSFLNTLFGIDFVRGGAIGLQLMAAGIAFAWISSILRNGITGLFEVMTLIQIFADVLSYLRLYALGLAGGIVSATAAEIASGLPFIAAVLLLMVAHMINMVLSTMSGVIHGLRLNFLEWYHYSFEGGGRKFQPLKLLEME